MYHYKVNDLPYNETKIKGGHLVNTIFGKLANKAQVTIGQAIEYVKDKMTSIFGTHSVTVQQLAEYIRNHPETKVETKELLGLTFSFYQLEKEKVHFYIVMKGSYILQIDVQSLDHAIVSYRSYRDSLYAPIKFPDSLTFE